MKTIDLNADTGEADTAKWQAVEAAVMAHISSASIACGGHAGNDKTMASTVRLAKIHNVNIGAHPAYPDRENFGRISKKLGEDISAKSLSASITAQISRLAEIAAQNDMALTYVKGHGALYNDAVFDHELADLIAKTVAKIDPNLLLVGAPDSCLTRSAQKYGLTFVAEGFVDRRYTDDGHLLSRTIDGAVLEDTTERNAQAVEIFKNKKVTTHSGKSLPLIVKTICLHSDSPGADKTAASVRKALEAEGAVIKAFTHAR